MMHETIHRRSAHFRASVAHSAGSGVKRLPSTHLSFEAGNHADNSPQWVFALYGAWAFFRRSIPDYLFLRTQFAFFDFSEPRIFFFLDYVAAMGTFVWIGHYLAKGVRRLKGGRNG